MTKDKIENSKLRILSGLGIIFIVTGHISFKNPFTLFEWIPLYSFHVPMFIMISGYFFVRPDNLWEFLWKKFEKFVIPFYLIYGSTLISISILKCFKPQITVGLTFTLYNWIIFPLTHNQPLGFAVASWFILMLFFAECLHGIIHYIFCKNDNSKIDLILFFIYFAIGLCCIRYVKNAPVAQWKWNILRVFMVLPFLQIGYLYKKHIEKRDKINNKAYFLIIFIIQFCLYRFHGNIDFGLWGNQTQFNKGGLLFYAVALTGTAFWLRIATILSDIKLCSVLKTCGRYSSAIMYWHMLGCWILSGIMSVFNKLGLGFKQFDFTRFYSEVYYSYIPKDMYAFVYIVFSIIFSISLSNLIMSIKKRLSKCQYHKRLEKILTINS